MLLELPDIPMNEKLTPAEMRLELACALYARGRIGKVAASQMAGIDFFSFQQALRERQVPLYTEEMLANDLVTLQEVVS